MIVCHVCGSQNDPVNRFCDQCGARLDAAQVAAETVVAEQQPVVEYACPACGTPALPGQAFCDNCGHDLSDIATHVANSANAPVEAAAALQPDDETMGVVTHHNQQHDQQHDQQHIDAAEVPVPAPVVYEETVLAVSTPDPDEPDNATHAASNAAAVSSSDETILDDDANALSTPAPSGTPAPTLADEQPPQPPIHDAAYEEQRLQLEGEMARHRATIAQMAQMMRTYPANSVPDYLVQGLQGAKMALASAEKKRAALEEQAVPYTPDPEQVKQLEQLISVHKDTVVQFEQMQSGYPAHAIPSFLEGGLKEAKNALAKAETDLANVLAGKSINQAAVVSLPKDQTNTLGSAPSIGGPRLELFDGKHEFPLPVDRLEFIIGREDPVSQIYPEVDLTSYGGEAGGVSRQHARINHTNGQWTITDLDSTNHTRVDGRRIEPSIPVPIFDGSKLQFGRIVAVFRSN